MNANLCLAQLCHRGCRGCRASEHVEVAQVGVAAGPRDRNLKWRGIGGAEAHAQCAVVEDEGEGLAAGGGVEGVAQSTVRVRLSVQTVLQENKKADFEVGSLISLLLNFRPQD